MQAALSAIDRLEVRGRDSAGLMLLLRDHGLDLTDPATAALAAHGLTLDPSSGEIAELAPYAARFSARAAQIGRNADRCEAEWRADHPGEEPGPKLRQAWDRRAWSQARPDKVVPRDGAELVAAWNEELRRLGATLAV